MGTTQERERTFDAREETSRGVQLRWIERSALDVESAGKPGITKHRATERAIHLRTASSAIAA